MILNLLVRLFQPRCRNEIGAIQACLTGMIMMIYCSAHVPLYGQSAPASLSSDSEASEPRTSSTAMLPADLRDYEISPDDLLYVYVFDVPDLSREYRVSPNGSIDLPLLPEPIAAGGLTPSQLSRVIRERLIASRLIGNPRVTVQVKESRMHSVAITGAVKRPQIYPVFGQTTFLDLLSQAEGLRDDAGNTAIITRGEVAERHLQTNEHVEGGQQPAIPATLIVDLRRLLEGGDATSNPVIYPGDRVTVPHAGVFYVLGAVNKPGGYNLRDAQQPTTVLMAIATAGNMTSTAKSQSAVLVRRNAQAPGGREEITLNLKEIASGHLSDQRLRADDIVFVPQSGGKQAAHAVLSAFGAIITTTTSGILIYGR